MFQPTISQLACCRFFRGIGDCLPPPSSAPDAAARSRRWNDGHSAWLRAGQFDTDRVRRFAAESFDAADGAATRRFVGEVVAPAMRA